MGIKNAFLTIVLLAAVASTSLAAKVLMVDLTISNNDTVALSGMMLVEGKPTAYAGGDYAAQVLDSAGNVLESQPLPVDFFISGIGKVDAVPVEARFSDYGSATKLQVLKGSRAIFWASIALCDNNGICENHENYLSCPNDCPSGSADGYCDKVKDGKCDPDCAKEVDPDCRAPAAASGQPFSWDASLVYMAAGVVAIFVILALVFALRKKPRANVGGGASPAKSVTDMETRREKPAEQPAAKQEPPKAEPALLDWARSQLAAGYTKDQLRAELLKYGYPAEAADELLKNV